MRARIKKYVQRAVYFTWRILLVAFSFGLLEYVAFRLDEQLKAKGTIVAASMTGYVVIFGYFITHYLEIERKRKKKRLEHCLRLIKGLRLWVLEGDIKGTEKQEKLRDEFQEAYFEAALTISSTSYEAFSNAAKAFGELLKDESKLDAFKVSQSKFINALRKEFDLDHEIDFETYDYRLHKEAIAT